MKRDKAILTNDTLEQHEVAEHFVAVVDALKQMLSKTRTNLRMTQGNVIFWNDVNASGQGNVFFKAFLKNPLAARGRSRIHDMHLSFDTRILEMNRYFFLLVDRHLCRWCGIIVCATCHRILP